MCLRLVGTALWGIISTRDLNTFFWSAQSKRIIGMEKSKTYWQAKDKDLNLEQPLRCHSFSIYPATRTCCPGSSQHGTRISEDSALSKDVKQLWKQRVWKGITVFFPFLISQVICWSLFNLLNQLQVECSFENSRVLLGPGLDCPRMVAVPHLAWDAQF